MASGFVLRCGRAAPGPRERRRLAVRAVYNAGRFRACPTMTADIPTDPRLSALETWLAGLLGSAPERVAPASADASFRRYFRVWHEGSTAIAMDAPPGREDLGPYVEVARILAAAGVHVPRVLAEDRAQGFLLLTDLGSRQYLDALRDGEDPRGLYADAIDALVRMQSCADLKGLPDYDAASLHREMALFPEWFVGRHLGIEVTVQLRRLFEASFAVLAQAALAQPVVLVHRDYHSRNLMVCAGNNPGVLDFQDAVRGPVTYDLVSLLKDCYITWPRQRVMAWLDLYRERAASAGIDVGGDRGAFIGAFDRMGLQRHIKVLGIFARLWYRDGKPGYLHDLPRVLDYTLEAVAGVDELSPFEQFLRERVLPAFADAQSRALAAA